MAQIYCGGLFNLGPWQCMGDSGVQVLPSDGKCEGRAMLRPSCVGGVVTGEVCTSHGTNNKHLHQAGGHPKAINALYLAGSHQHPTTHTSTSTMRVWGASCTKHCNITGDGMWPNYNVWKIVLAHNGGIACTLITCPISVCPPPPPTIPLMVAHPPWECMVAMAPNRPI
jgi:hypothetical protein